MESSVGGCYYLVFIFGLTFICFPTSSCYVDLLPHSSLNSFPCFLCYFISFCLPFFLISIFSMANFCVDGWPNFTIFVNGTDITIVIEKCLCVMFGFQPGSQHIFKDVTYDANNNISSSMYQISIDIVQGQEWVVSSGRYRVVGANVFTHS